MNLSENFPAEKDAIDRAQKFAAKRHSGQKRKSGEPYITHPEAVAEILIEEGLGPETIQAALMHDLLEDTKTTPGEIKEGWGEEVCALVEGITKVEQIGEKRGLETYRKMLLAATDDARVLVIKLADRLHNMRTISALSPEKRKKVAEETLAVYAPIAHRLGLSKIRTELEDRSLAVLDPEAYKEATLIQRERRASGRAEMQRLQNKIRRGLREEGVEPIRISSRVKSKFSIAEKMRRREKSDILDVLGIRVIVSGKSDCYLALGVIHSIWPPVPDQFDDYIAVPRGNLYQSIHTTVMTRGRPVEIQIRTGEMDDLAERGIAAHWKYKANIRGDSSHSAEEWVYTAQAESEASDELDSLLREMRKEAFSEEIYLFTPKGDVRILPEGSNAIDFAYSIHTEVGGKTAGARVDGKLWPITKALPSGSRIEIITKPEAHPTGDWVDTVKTAKARSRIRSSLVEEETRDKAEEGLEKIRQALKSSGLTPLAENLEKSLRRAGFDDLEEVGRKALRNKSIVRSITREIVQAASLGAPEKPLQKARRAETGDNPIEVQGMEGVLLRMAGCCKPSPGAEIIGFVSLGRGVSIHRKSCKEISRWQKKSPERIVEAHWKEDAGNPLREIVFTSIQIEAHLLETITAIEDSADIQKIEITREGDLVRTKASIRLHSREAEVSLEESLMLLQGALDLEGLRLPKAQDAP